MSPAALNTAGATKSTSASLAMSLATVCAAVLASAAAGCVEHHGQRTVEARPEARGEQVIGLALGRGWPGDAVVGQPAAEGRGPAGRSPRGASRAPTRTSSGRREMNVGQRSHTVLRAGSPLLLTRRSMRRPSTRSPAKPMRAGRRVSATSTATATVTAAATPISVRIGMPTSDSPVSAMTTVRPAKKTALPAVPTARPMASSGSRSASSASSERNRDRMNSA